MDIPPVTPNGGSHQPEGQGPIEAGNTPQIPGTTPTGGSSDSIEKLPGLREGLDKMTGLTLQNDLFEKFKGYKG